MWAHYGVVVDGGVLYGDGVVVGVDGVVVGARSGGGCMWSARGADGGVVVGTYGGCLGAYMDWWYGGWVHCGSAHGVGGCMGMWWV